MENLVIKSPQGRDVTTSLIVAQVFGKEHRKVCRDIESLSCSREFRVLNFEEAEFENLKTRQRHKMYEMTKDGFSFLVMGYNGQKAGEFKELFINEFNKREQMLKSDDYILARSQEILRKRLSTAEQQLQIAQAERDHYQEEVRALSPKAQYTDEVLQSTSTFTATQIAKSIGMAAVSFNKWLHSLGIIFKQSGTWMLTHKYQNQGLTEMRVAKYVDANNNEIKTTQSLVWTEKGRQFIHQLKAQN